MRYEFIPRLFVSFGFFVISFIGCSSNKFLLECNEIVKSDSTEYFVAGLMDHTELKKEWIIEEINQKDIKSWFQKYVEKNTSDLTYLDSLELKKIKNRELENYFKEWQTVENKITKSDKVFYYSTPEEYWYVLAGQDGLVIIRGCKIKYVLVLMQS